MVELHAVCARRYLGFWHSGRFSSTPYSCFTLSYLFTASAYAFVSFLRIVVFQHQRALIRLIFLLFSLLLQYLYPNPYLHQLHHVLALLSPPVSYWSVYSLLTILQPIVCSTKHTLPTMTTVYFTSQITQLTTVSNGELNFCSSYILIFSPQNKFTLVLQCSYLEQHPLSYSPQY